MNSLTYPIFREQHAQGTTWNPAWAELLPFNYSFYNKLNTSKLFGRLWLRIKLSIITQKCYKLHFSTASLPAFMLLRLVACWLDGKLFRAGSMSFILQQGPGEWGTPILFHGGIAAAQVMVIMITADKWNKWCSANLFHFSCIHMKGREYNYDPNFESEDQTRSVTVLFSLHFSWPDYTPY